MKLLSHNHLLCLNKNCKSNFALIIDPKKVIQIESEPKLSFMLHILSMIDYDVLKMAASQIGMKDLPSKLPSKQIMETSESFLRSMQKVLLDTNIVEGKLSCSKCKTSYMISNGIVDMMHPQLHKAADDDEEEKKENDDDTKTEDVDMSNFLNENDEDDDIGDDDNATKDMVDID